MLPIVQPVTILFAGAAGFDPSPAPVQQQNNQQLIFVQCSNTMPTGSQSIPSAPPVQLVADNKEKRQSVVVGEKHMFLTPVKPRIVLQ